MLSLSCGVRDVVYSSVCLTTSCQALIFRSSMLGSEITSSESLVLALCVSSLGNSKPSPFLMSHPPVKTMLICIFLFEHLILALSSLPDMKELMHLFQHLSQFRSNLGSEKSRAQSMWTAMFRHLEHYS